VRKSRGNTRVIRGGSAPWQSRPPPTPVPQRDGGLWRPHDGAGTHLKRL